MSRVSEDHAPLERSKLPVQISTLGKRRTPWVQVKLGRFENQTNLLTRQCVVTLGNILIDVD